MFRNKSNSSLILAIEGYNISLGGHRLSHGWVVVLFCSNTRYTVLTLKCHNFVTTCGIKAVGTSFRPSDYSLLSVGAYTLVWGKKFYTCRGVLVSIPPPTSRRQTVRRSRYKLLFDNMGPPLLLMLSACWCATLRRKYHFVSRRTYTCRT